MTTETGNSPAISATSTKKEILDAYNSLLKTFETKAQTELKPERIKAEREKQEVVQTADAVAAHGVIGTINELIGKTGRALAEIASKLEGETERYNKLKKAIEVKKGELHELFEIEKSAFTLAAAGTVYRSRNRQHNMRAVAAKDYARWKREEGGQLWRTTVFPRGL